METLIRPARMSDAEALIHLSRRTLSNSYRSFLGDDAVDGFLNSGEPDRYVQVNLDRCMLIEADGQVAGFAVYRDNLIDHRRPSPGARDRPALRG